MFVPQYKKLIKLYDFVKEYNEKNPDNKIGLDCKQREIIQVLQKLDKKDK